ncbi:uncharacterized protein LOC128041726 [Gossypium raimondii]|uniref:uncharacterized protein LOC128041726 n=1 Tax=Gossypium raimondii TaxID=29730 RepID=UPI00227BE059|nr:uncharacterized protein LOC128041726 [Gossypium raimondii]
MVFLKVSSWKKFLRFGQKGKLSPRFIGPYEVAKQIGLVAYRLLLPLELERTHYIFHVSMLWKYIYDPFYVVPVKEIEVRSNHSYEEEPVATLDRKVNVLCNKTVLFVTVLCRNHKIEEATWESKDVMKC